MTTIRAIPAAPPASTDGGTRRRLPLARRAPTAVLRCSARRSDGSPLWPADPGRRPPPDALSGVELPLVRVDGNQQVERLHRQRLRGSQAVDESLGILVASRLHQAGRRATIVSSSVPPGAPVRGGNGADGEAGITGSADATGGAETTGSIGRASSAGGACSSNTSGSCSTGAQSTGSAVSGSSAPPKSHLQAPGPRPRRVPERSRLPPPGPAHASPLPGPTQAHSRHRAPSPGRARQSPCFHLFGDGPPLLRCRVFVRDRRRAGERLHVCLALPGRAPRIGNRRRLFGRHGGRRLRLHLLGSRRLVRKRRRPLGLP